MKVRTQVDVSEAFDDLRSDEQLEFINECFGNLSDVEQFDFLKEHIEDLHPSYQTELLEMLQENN